MNVRRFEKEDAPAIRRICAENGALPEGIRPDDRLFSDYWTWYYLRLETDHTWVAERDGVVEGYLTASFDTRRFRRAMRWCVLPWLLLRVTLIGAIRHPASRMFLLKRIAVWANPEPDPEDLLDRFPAHVHVNLAETARGRGIGTALMTAFLEEAKRSGLRGVHAEAAATNDAARRYFGKAGFREIGTKKPFRKVDPALADRTILVLAREI